MTVLTVNAGSSSIRFAIMEASGNAHVCRAAHHGNEPPTNAETVLRHFLGGTASAAIHAVAHRIVHGGDRLVQPCFISQDIEDEIARLAKLAPLHNPAALAWIRACRAVLGPNVPHVAVFDTAFYRDLPRVARTYALPRTLCEQFSLRRYGFHGLAHQAMWHRWRQLQTGTQTCARVISLQLGAGCSITAVRDGRAVDTSMGFSPLEGLVMATRSGDVDPGLLLYLQRTLPMTPEHMERLLNHESGLLGVSGASADMRALLASNDAAARSAVELYGYRARKYVGAYLAVLGGVDAILFGGGVGENAPAIRENILGGLEWAGIALDTAVNRRTIGREQCVSPVQSNTQIWVVPVDEATILAEQAHAVLAT